MEDRKVRGESGREVLQEEVIEVEESHAGSVISVLYVPVRVYIHPLSHHATFADSEADPHYQVCSVCSDGNAGPHRTGLWKHTAVCTHTVSVEGSTDVDLDRSRIS